jgi:hypothetical protein
MRFLITVLCAREAVIRRRREHREKMQYLAYEALCVKPLAVGDPVGALGL